MLSIITAGLVAATNVLPFLNGRLPVVACSSALEILFGAFADSPEQLVARRRCYNY